MSGMPATLGRAAVVRAVVVAGACAEVTAGIAIAAAAATRRERCMETALLLGDDWGPNFTPPSTARQPPRLPRAQSSQLGGLPRGAVVRLTYSESVADDARGVARQAPEHAVCGGRRVLSTTLTPYEVRGASAIGGSESRARRVSVPVFTETTTCISPLV